MTQPTRPIHSQARRQVELHSDDAAGFEQPVESMPQSAATESASMCAAEWDLLFNAVEARLGSIARTLLDEADGLPKRNTTVAAQDAIAECAQALQQLHHVLADERRQHRVVEDFLGVSTAALAKARASLVDALDQARRTRQQASHDSLTASPNRRHFGNGVDQAVALAGPASSAVAAVYIDLDGFKLINDLHGRAIGDQVLKIVARRLVHAVRTQDKVGRLGGDKFACLLMNRPGLLQLQAMAGKLLEAVSAPMQIDNLEITVRASIGIAMHPDDGESSQTLLYNADTAMYRAKQQCSGFAS